MTNKTQIVLCPRGKKIGEYTYCKSTRPGNKLMVHVDGKTIHFGDSNMEHYKDKTGIWKSKDHGDEKRRESYRKRAGGIRNKKGDLVVNDPKSANYHAYHILW